MNYFRAELLFFFRIQCQAYSFLHFSKHCAGRIEAHFLLLSKNRWTRMIFSFFRRISLESIQYTFHLHAWRFMWPSRHRIVFFPFGFFFVFSVGRNFFSFSLLQFVTHKHQQLSYNVLQNKYKKVKYTHIKCATIFISFSHKSRFWHQNFRTELSLWEATEVTSHTTWRLNSEKLITCCVIRIARHNVVL